MVTSNHTAQEYPDTQANFSPPLKGQKREMDPVTHPRSSEELKFLLKIEIINNQGVRYREFTARRI
jgi:hypothetical protein